MSYREEEYPKLYGRKVVAVDGSTLFLDTGAAWHFGLEGDCCSTSDYTPEGLEAFKELVGATIAKIESRPSWDNHVVDDDKLMSAMYTAREAALVERYPPDDHDCWHFLVFVTDKGHVTIDWRNQSTGYYDGWVNLTAAPPLHPVIHDAIIDGKSIAEIKKMLAAQVS